MVVLDKDHNYLLTNRITRIVILLVPPSVVPHRHPVAEPAPGGARGASEEVGELGERRR